MSDQIMDLEDDYAFACLFTYYVFHTEFFSELANESKICEQLNIGIEQSVQRTMRLLCQLDSDSRRKLLAGELGNYIKFIAD